MTQLTRADLAQFTGDAEVYRHPLNPYVLITQGVRYLAETGGAWWLTDAIASHFGSPAMLEAMRDDPLVETFQCWSLHVHQDRSAVLTARADSGVPPFITQRIPWTDFPLDEIDIWAGRDDQYWTLYLPSEH
ncbi:MAG: DUF6876 family protein [Planctomycetota bacterium]